MLQGEQQEKTETKLMCCLARFKHTNIDVRIKHKPEGK
jgi:hypothetical protein